jgi:hypothetical protein
LIKTHSGPKVKGKKLAGLFVSYFINPLIFLYIIIHTKLIVLGGLKIMDMDTIISRDGKMIYHGTIVAWISESEFHFVPAGKGYSKGFWGKTDFWNVKEASLV